MNNKRLAILAAVCFVGGAWMCGGIDIAGAALVILGVVLAVFAWARMPDSW